MAAHAISASRRALAGLLAGLALPAGAIGLGELQMHSFLGEPLDATVALAMAPESRPRPDCFALGRARMGELPAVPRASFAVETDGTGWRVRIRTRAIISEPASQLRLTASCEAKEAASRDYEILLDPRPAEAPPQALRSLPGDTLASLAAAIYPKSRAVRDAYVQALRVANPALAALAADEPLPPGTAIALPDLRRFSMSLAVSPAAPRPALSVVKPPAAAAPAVTSADKTPAPPPAAPPKRPPDAPKIAKTDAPKPPKAEVPKPVKTEAPTPAKTVAPQAPSDSAEAVAPKPPPPARATAAPKGGQFVLRLSSSEVDLSRSRGIDDRTRAQLRERLLVLDADDQVAALLAMRDSLKQLEGRVAELQLKLSLLPAAPPVAPAAPPPPAPAAAPAAPAAAAKPQPLPEKAAAPDAKPAVSESEKAATPDTKAPAPAAEREAARDAKPATPAARDRQLPPKADGLPSWAWGVLALLVAAIAVLVWRVLRRPREEEPSPEDGPESDSALDEAQASMRDGEAAEPSARAHRVVADSDASLSTHVPGADPLALRRRYIEERFPEIASGTIALDNPDSVVKAARLFYEDGALARAVELLQYTVEEMPDSMKPWLALFEIFRLEGLAREFAELARRFREHHGASDNWRKVQYIGREIDSQNALYRDAPFNTLETIGYAAPKKGAAITFDPLAENWLNAPMDFATDALVASLRAGLMADAGLHDSDLVADPMPALKNVEMFNVA